MHVPFAPLAQLDRASGYEPGGRRFESCRAHHSLQQLTGIGVGGSCGARPFFVPPVMNPAWNRGPRQRLKRSGGTAVR